MIERIKIYPFNNSNNKSCGLWGQDKITNF